MKFKIEDVAQAHCPATQREETMSEDEKKHEKYTRLVKEASQDFLQKRETASNAARQACGFS
jgi:hypothetical protein